jgi:SWI/SNF-related matrix-associated actin-dependent regulator of chromatin subfamily A member 5
MAWVLYSETDANVITYQRLNGIMATLREAQPEDTLEKLEEEREAVQLFIDTGSSLLLHLVFFLV